jgi:DNA primase
MTVFDIIKANLPILQVIQDYSKLKKAGIYWKGPCPFHSETNASFTVSPHKEIFYCFGCHAGGDVISFIARAENCSQLDAAKFLIERYSIAVPENILTASSPQEHEERDMYLRIYEAVAVWAQEQLAHTALAKTYLINRGISQKSCSLFMLGYFPGGLQAVNTFMKAMRTHNIIAKDLVEANILIEGKNIFYSPFEERILFPIRDHMGRCCGFGGRTFKEHDERPKYYNSKESALFAKGSLLFGLNVAKKAIQEKGITFLVEGYTDCIAMVQNGYPNTVATLGTACTIEHLKQIGRHAHTIHMLYDGDAAGQKAIVRLAELCWQTSLELKVITLPETEDPASFLAKNTSLEPLINDAQDIFFFLLNAMGKDFHAKPLNEKLTNIRKFISIIKSIDDQLKQDLLLNQAARVFDLPFQTLKHEMSTGKSAHTQPIETTTHKEASLTLEGYTLEKKILSAIINNSALLTEDTKLYLTTYLPKPLTAVFSKLCSAKSSPGGVNFGQFFGTLSEEEKSMVSRLMLDEETQITDETFRSLMQHMHRKYWRLFTVTIKKRLAEARAEGNQEVISHLVEEFAAVKKSTIDNQSEHGGS